MTEPPGGAVDYQAIWTGRWGDLQRFGPVSRHQRRIVARLLEGLEVASALDVGCGEGSHLRALRRLFPGARLAGVDVSAQAVAQARLACPDADLTVGAAASLGGGARYDLVTCLDVLEHVDDDVGLLEQLAALSRRWVLCMTVQGTMRRGERDIGHVRNYRPGELASKLRGAGLVPIAAVEWGFPFFSPLFRSAVAGAGAEPLSYGRYGPGRRALCHALYALFLLNSWRRGDKIFLLAEVDRARPAVVAGRAAPR